MRRIHFKVSHPKMGKAACLLLCGDCDALGNWNTERAPQFQRSGPRADKLTLSIKIPIKAQYKLVESAGNSHSWEWPGVHNRSLPGNLTAMPPHCDVIIKTSFGHKFQESECSYVCKQLGCGNPTFNGKQDAHCTRACRDWVPVNPLPWTFNREKHKLVAFFYPGEEAECDQLCRSCFLGNFFDVSPSRIAISSPQFGTTFHFRTAEAAFQALKFWSRAHEFQDDSGDDALKRKNQLKMKGMKPDVGFSGYGSNWLAMMAVLEAKFSPGTPILGLLLQTQDAFLLEHDDRKCPFPSVWSDNHDGTGRNWLGLQLMWLRENRKPKTGRWYDYLRPLFDFETGHP